MKTLAVITFVPLMLAMILYNIVSGLFPIIIVAVIAWRMFG